MSTFTISVEDGKYEWDVSDETGQLVACRRNGEPWPAGFESRFSKSHMALLLRIRALEMGLNDILTVVEEKWRDSAMYERVVDLIPHLRPQKL